VLNPSATPSSFILLPFAARISRIRNQVPTPDLRSSVRQMSIPTVRCGLVLPLRGWRRRPARNHARNGARTEAVLTLPIRAPGLGRERPCPPFCRNRGSSCPVVSPLPDGPGVRLGVNEPSASSEDESQSQRSRSAQVERRAVSSRGYRLSTAAIQVGVCPKGALGCAVPVYDASRVEAETL
jgi:hypothetical protein